MSSQTPLSVERQAKNDSTPRSTHLLAKRKIVKKSKNIYELMNIDAIEEKRTRKRARKTYERIIADALKKVLKVLVDTLKGNMLASTLFVGSTDILR